MIKNAFFFHTLSRCYYKYVILQNGPILDTEAKANLF